MREACLVERCKRGELSSLTYARLQAGRHHLTVDILRKSVGLRRLMWIIISLIPKVTLKRRWRCHERRLKRSLSAKATSCEHVVPRSITQRSWRGSLLYAGLQPASQQTLWALCVGRLLLPTAYCGSFVVETATNNWVGAMSAYYNEIIL